MLVVDTSAFVSLGITDCHGPLVEEFDVHTTRRVIEELRETAGHDDEHGRAAKDVLDRRAEITVHDVEGPLPESSRVDGGEASCTVLCRSTEADFLLTDDVRALPELERLVETDVAISPIALRALVTRGVLAPGAAREQLETIARSRNWLEAPIYERALALFEDL